MATGRVQNRSLRSTAVHARESVESILFGHEKGALPARLKSTPGNSSRQMAARCSSTKSLIAGPAQGAARNPGGRSRVVDGRNGQGRRAHHLSTNRDLIADVKSGRFREDLFIACTFPAVSTAVASGATFRNSSDISSHALPRKKESGYGPSAHGMALLTAYHWPGTSVSSKTPCSVRSYSRAARRLAPTSFRLPLSFPGDLPIRRDQPSPAMVSSWPDPTVPSTRTGLEGGRNIHCR
jgi:hypothetical protein